MSLRIRPLLERDLPEADRVLRMAFGTFLGLPDPMAFLGDGDYVRNRQAASPESAFVAELDGRVVASNFATRWGSFGFFGPLTVDPAVQDQGLGSALIEPVLAVFERWGVTHTGLFTFPSSAKHLGLYQKFGFRPRAMTLIMDKLVDASHEPATDWTTYSRLHPETHGHTLSALRDLTDRIYPGLDVTSEIRALRERTIGDTVLIGHDPFTGFAACHTGPGSEAGSGVCYVKFGAVAPERVAAKHFRTLLAACEAYAANIGATQIVAGVNAARSEAYEILLASGFRIFRTGIAMHRPNEPGFSHPGAFVIDDWR